MRRTRAALLPLLAAGLIAAGCASGGGAAPIEPVTAVTPSPTGDAAVVPRPADDGGAAEEPVSGPEAMAIAEQLAAASIAVAETRDPFEPVREPDVGAAEGAAPVAAVPTAPTGEATVPSAPTGTAAPGAPTEPPTSEPAPDTCAGDIDRCLATLRLIDAGTPPSGPAILQVGTTLFEVEIGGEFADAFVLLELRDSCATVAHPNGVVERCVEPGSSLK